MKKIVIFSVTALFYSMLCQTAQAKSPENKLFRSLACAKAFEALGRIGDPSSADVLVKGLKSKDFIVRICAIEALGRVNEKKAIPFLREQLKDQDYLVKVMATKALLSLGEKDMEEKLLGFLGSDDPAIRAAAVEQLGQFKQEYMERLTRVIAEDKSPTVRIKAIQQAGVNKYTPASAFLVKELDDTYPYVRQAACIALGKVGYSPARILIEQKLSDSEAIVRAAAKEGYGMLINPGIPSDAYIKLLWKDMESKEPVLRASSFVCLAAQRQINVLPVLLKEIVDPATPTILRIVSARGLKALKPALDSSLDEITKSKQPALSSRNLELNYKVSGKGLLSILIAALNNPKDPLHKDASAILGELRDETALPELRQALSQDDLQAVAGVAYVLGLFKDKGSVPHLIRLCRNYGF